MEANEFQKEVNQRVQEISIQLSYIPNIGNDYIEYISALIYVLYENIEEIQKVIKQEKVSYTLEYIDKELENIRGREKSEVLFKNIRFSKIISKPYHITIEKIINSINALILLLINMERPKKILAEAFEYIIMKSEQDNDKISGNEVFYTPKGLVKTMTKLLNIENGKGIYNPACGTGNFIVESAKLANIYAFGEEKSIRNYNICMTNLWIHDINNKLIKQDTLEEIPQVRYAISNPPFKEDIKENTEKELYGDYYITPNADSYIKILIKMINTIDENGRMAIILPQGFLFKKTNTEYELRKKLIEKKYIDSIIELPEKLFYRTKTPAIILIIDKAKKSNDILFIDASKEYESKRRTNILTEKNQEKIIDIYNRRKTIENFSYVSSLKEIIENSYDLSVKRYIQVKSKIKQIDREETEMQIRRLENQIYEIQYKIKKTIEKMNEEN